MKFIFWCIVASAAWNIVTMPLPRVDCDIKARRVAQDVAIRYNYSAAEQASFEQGTYTACRKNPWWMY